MSFRGGEIVSVYDGYLLSRRLPQPITVAILPSYEALPRGKHMARIVSEYLTGLSRVKMATSLY
jgi:hypothetical protein